MLLCCNILTMKEIDSDSPVVVSLTLVLLEYLFGSDMDVVISKTTKESKKNEMNNKKNRKGIHITHTHTICMHTGNGKLWMDCDQFSSFIIIFFTWNSKFQKSQTIIIIIIVLFSCFFLHFWYPYIYENSSLRHAWWMEMKSEKETEWVFMRETDSMI